MIGRPTMRLQACQPAHLPMACTRLPRLRGWSSMSLRRANLRAIRVEVLSRLVVTLTTKIFGPRENVVESWGKLQRRHGVVRLRYDAPRSA